MPSLRAPRARTARRHATAASRAAFHSQGSNSLQRVDLGAPGDDALEHVGQLGLGIDIVQFRGVDQRRQDRPSLASGIGPGEQSVLPAQRDRTDAALDGVVVDLHPAIGQEHRQSLPMTERVADRRRQRWTSPRSPRAAPSATTTAPPSAASSRPDAPRPARSRYCPGSAPRWRKSRRSGAAPPPPIASLVRLCTSKNIPPRMRQAISQRDRAGWTARPGQFVVARVTIDLKHAVESLEMLFEMTPSPVLRVKIDHDRRRGSFPGPVIHRVAPQPSDPRSFPGAIQHRQRRVVAEDFVRRHHGLEQKVVQRLQPPGRALDPVHQR